MTQMCRINFIGEKTPPVVVHAPKEIVASALGVAQAANEFASVLKESRLGAHQVLVNPQAIAYIEDQGETALPGH